MTPPPDQIVFSAARNLEVATSFMRLLTPLELFQLLKVIQHERLAELQAFITRTEKED